MNLKESLIYVLSGQVWTDEGDPRVKCYPMLGEGPTSMFLVMLAYLCFVMKFGPYLMRDRRPFELRTTMLIYNIFMVVANAYFLYEFVFIIKFGSALLDLNFPDRSDSSPQTRRSLNIVYFYYLTKFVDLLDTVFFVLRKKYSQVTALHLYHHFSVPTLGWLVMKIGPLVPGILLFAILNTAVHVVMYSYYALAAFGPTIQKYLWWKKYLTQIQLIQFVILLVYCLASFPFYRGYRPIYLWLGASQPPVFLCLFLNFYIQSYKNSYKSTTFMSKNNFKTLIKNQ